MNRLRHASPLLFCMFLSYTLYAAPKDDPTNLWSGFYAGLNAGVVKHTVSLTDIDATTFYSTIQEAVNPQFTGGLQVGYRHQLTDLTHTNASGVYGLEFSTDFARAGFNQVYGSSYALYQINAENEFKNAYLMQLMGGIAVEKTWLFLTAGLSWTNTSVSLTSLESTPYFTSFDANKIAFGNVLGGGIEYALTHAISARLKLDVITPNTYTAFNSLDDAFQISNRIVQGLVGLNYRFR